MSLQSSFESYLNRKGKPVTIIQIPKTTTENEAGDPIPGEAVEISTKCRLLDKNEYERNPFGNIKVKGNYKIGLFKFADAEYLEEDNKVKYTDPAGKTTIFDIKSMNRAESHYEVILV